MKKLFAVSVLSVWLIACQYSYVRSPRPVKKDTLELVVDLNWLIDAVEPAGSKWYIPMPSFSVFYSPADNSDIGLSVYPAGVEVSGRYGIVNNDRLTLFTALRLGRIFVGGVPLEKSVYIEPSVQAGYKLNDDLVPYGALRGTVYFSRFGTRFVPGIALGLDQFIGGKSFWLWEFNAMLDRYAPFSFASGYRWRNK